MPAGTGTKVVVHNLYQVESGDSTEQENRKFLERQRDRERDSGGV